MVTVFISEGVFVNVLFFFSLWTQLLIDVLSCYILWDSFRRIKGFSKDNESIDVNENMVRLHIVSYSLFLVSLLLYFGSYAMPSTDLVSFMTALVSITNTISQAILGYIFLCICNSKKAQIQLKPTKINPSETGTFDDSDDSSSEEEYLPFD